MDKFKKAFRGKIFGVLSCFDRIIFHGHLLIAAPRILEDWMTSLGYLLKEFGVLAQKQSQTLREHAQDTAKRFGRQYEYLEKNIRKEDAARNIAEREGIIQGLVCIFAVLETCWSFKLKYADNRPCLQRSKRRCVFLYYYYIDREFGLMHIRIQTWFPFQIQIYMNGHNWLARKMDQHGIDYQQVENAFTWIDDVERAQKFADRFPKKKFVRTFAAMARRVNPLVATGGILHDVPFDSSHDRDSSKDSPYFWVTDQSEYATDVMFKSVSGLQAVFPNLLKGAVSLSAEDVMTFLGRKLDPRFAGEIITDCKRRLPGVRVKHRAKGNWIKMYDKHGCVLRIETVINFPQEFRVRRKARRKGVQVVDWFPMAKGVCNLYRYADVSLRANSRYLEALASVHDPERAYKLLDRVCEPARFKKRKVRGFNPLAKKDVEVFSAVVRGEHTINGFRNGDLMKQLHSRVPEEPLLKRRLSACVTRLIQRLRAHGLVVPISHSRRYKVTPRGYALMTAAVHLRDEGIPVALKLAS